jgi:TFIIS helical bundle-like domain
MLAETQAGKSIKRLTVHGNAAISTAAKDVVRTWRDALLATVNNPSPSAAVPTGPEAARKKPPVEARPVAASSSASKERNIATVKSSGDAARDRIRAAFADGLKLADGGEGVFCELRQGFIRS